MGKTKKLFNVRPFKEEYRTLHNLPMGKALGASGLFRKRIKQLLKCKNVNIGKDFLKSYYLTRLFKELGDRPMSKCLELGFGLCVIKSKEQDEVNLFNAPIWSAQFKISDIYEYISVCEVLINISKPMFVFHIVLE